MTGGPGIGKSAACIVASRYLHSYRCFCDGVYFVDLRNLQFAAVPFTIGSALQKLIHSEEELYAELSERDCLVVLDGCESLLTQNMEFTKFLSTILRRTRYCKMLISSRQELNLSIDNEVVFQPYSVKVRNIAFLTNSSL